MGLPHNQDIFVASCFLYSAKMTNAGQEEKIYHK